MILAAAAAAVFAADPPRLPVPQPSEGQVNFSFDQVDVRSFVKIVGELTGRKFVVSDNVAGKLTVVSPKIAKVDVYPLFVQILESGGFSVVDEGSMLRVVALPPRSTYTAPVVTNALDVPFSGLVTRVLRLNNVSAAEVRKALETHVGGGKLGALAAVEETNHLIITDTAENIRRLEQIIAELDQPGLARLTEVIRLQYASAEEIAEQINATLDETYDRAEAVKNRFPPVPGAGAIRSGRRSASVVPAPHSNSLILVGSQRQVEEMKRIILQVDVDAPQGNGRMNAIFLKYIDAVETAKSLNALLGKTPATGGAAPAIASASATRRISIEAMAANNALLVDAMPGDTEVVRKLVEQLDKLPEQLLISVLIAEYSLGDGLKFGVELAAVDMPDDSGSTVVQGGMRLSDSAATALASVQSGLFPGGITVGLASGTGIDSEGKPVVSYPGFLNIDAVKKSSMFKIQNETSLAVQNNKEATVNIVDQIPILKSTVSSGAGTARDVIQNIDRIDVGIKLKLVPHILPGNLVQMDLHPSIEAVIEQNTANEAYTPTIARREVSTTVTVPDGQMIVIAGLTRTDKTRVEKRVPVLGSIPFIGYLFRHMDEEEKKTNLLIWVTPTIIDNPAKAQSVLRDMEQRTGLKPDETN
jgi:general secretion pathway protein D